MFLIVQFMAENDLTTAATLAMGGNYNIIQTFFYFF